MDVCEKRLIWKCRKKLLELELGVMKIESRTVSKQSIIYTEGGSIADHHTFDLHYGDHCAPVAGCVDHREVNLEEEVSNFAHNQ